MPAYEVAKYDLIWICDSGIRGKCSLWQENFHSIFKVQLQFDRMLLSLLVFGFINRTISVHSSLK